jgi:hypothetical protein
MCGGDGVEVAWVDGEREKRACPGCPRCPRTDMDQFVRELDEAVRRRSGGR